MIVCPELSPKYEGGWGVFRVMMRTDGKWIVYDPRRPIGKMTVKVFRYSHEATQAAEAWHRQGHG